MTVIFRAIERIKDFDGLKAMVSISGGSDSDIVIDLCHKYIKDCTYVFFNTGLEYNATLEHLDYLEERYNVSIERLKPKMSIVTSCKQYGLPFISKNVSQFIERLQSHKYDFNGECYEKDIRDYPDCISALNWFYNKNGYGSQFNIAVNKGLREFLISEPPSFKISAKCCQYVKKDVAKDYLKSKGFDVNILGLRRAEKGLRSLTIKSCFNVKEDVNEYYPIWWFTDRDKREYNRTFGIVNSRCYTEYGLLRTGCAGCPFGIYCQRELYAMMKYEPKLYHAVMNVFNDSYIYTTQYRSSVEYENFVD